MKSENYNLDNLIGSYDNFLQIWKEQTEDDIHRDKRGFAHEHIHLKIERATDSTEAIKLSLFKGRNNKFFVGEKVLTKDDIGESKNHIICVQDNGSIHFSDGLGLIDDQNEEPYILTKCRFFSGFIEYPMPEDPDTIHRMGNLEIHDQGGMVQLDYEGVDYTIELTQLIFAHKIELMKLAIYDLPLNKVDINSKAISYTWTSPESKRLGINLRKLISGWTYIEDGFLSSNNMDLEEQT